MSSASRPRRSTAYPLVFLSLTCTILALLGGWRAYVDGLRDGPSLEKVCQVLACDPNQLARLADRLADSEPEEQPNALRFSLLALANDPASPFRWCDLGDLYMGLRGPSGTPRSVEYLQQARSCFRRAEKLAPSNPNILQRIANFYFQTGELAEALKRSFKILQRVREFDEITFSSYARFGVPQPEVLAHGVPSEPEPARSYLRFVLARNDVAAATAAWHWASSVPGTQTPFVTDALSKSYVSLLWRQGEFSSAAQAWAAYLGSRAGDYPRTNRIFNGSFETDPADDNPLDWKRDQAERVEMQRDTQVHQTSQASMRIAFPGTQNLDFHQFSQTQPVPPGAYRFRAMVKIQGVTTDQGVRLRIIDPEVPARLDVSTPAMTGSSDWHAVELPVEVRVPTRLVRVEVARQPSLKFDNKIAGTLWLDAVSLTPAD